MHDELQKCRIESLKEGEMKGLKEGKTNGLKEGEARKAKKMAISLAEQGVPIEVIAKSAKVSTNTVKRWLQGEKKEENTDGLGRTCRQPDYEKFGDEIPDSRLTVPVKKLYRVREAILETKRLGRPLTEEEMEKYYIKDF